MKASPRWLRSTAPWPRTASEIRKREAPGPAKAVGWNWKNSRSATTAPARKARATPSPVEIAGFVVRE
jgi:hypothetical protein